MSVDDILKSITERIKGTARIETIYGEPREVAGKTVIPIAKVSYGFGAGAGEGKGKSTEEGEVESGGGGGGGGGVSVEPVGFLVAEDEGLRFLPVTDKKKIIAALAGFFIGIIIARKLSKK